jgi:hypothetical protein
MDLSSLRCSPQSQRPAPWLLALLLLVSSALGARPALAQSGSTGGVTVTADIGWPALNDRNYAYLRTQVENLVGEPRTVRMEVQLWGYGISSPVGQPRLGLGELHRRRST